MHHACSACIHESVWSTGSLQQGAKQEEEVSRLVQRETGVTIDKSSISRLKGGTHCNAFCAHTAKCTSADGASGLNLLKVSC